jgi:uncharacterized protein YcgI (DUF1989 family)
LNIVKEVTAAPNTGWASPMEKGQLLRLTTMTIIDFVAFNADDLNERFDQARTKVYNMKIWISTGDTLMSKRNNPMMTVIDDQFAGIGTHDMQFGMCGRARHKRAREEGRLGEYLHGGDIEVPDHGCAENLTRAMEPYGVAYEDIPSPLNLFQNMEIDPITGVMKRTRIRPEAPVNIDLRAEMDLIIAFSACPDLASATGGREVKAAILGP